MIRDLYVVPEPLVGLDAGKLDRFKLQDLDMARYGAFTAYEVVDKMGFKSADVALPIDWCRDFQETVGEWPVGHMVWSYDGNTFIGEPAAITREGEAYLKIYKYIKEKK